MEKVEYEANVYRNHGVNGIILENMHDTPYSRGQDLGDISYRYQSYRGNLDTWHFHLDIRKSTFYNGI